MKIFLRIVTALTTAIVVTLLIVKLPPKALQWIFPVLLVVSLIEFYMLSQRKVALLTANGFMVHLLGTFFLTFAFANLAIIATNWGNYALLYVLALVKLSDMGGFAVGLSSARLMKGGNHKLCPSISPNKSWEGLGGSVLASSLISMAFVSITHFGYVTAVLMGVIAALLGTLGDLIESKFKRWVGVKDSATFMPAGLGGFLDMFDSLLIAPAVLLWFF